MKAVVFKDRNGYLRRVLVRDTDGDEMAQYGLPAGPPDLEEIDWEQIKREINNILVQGGMFDHISLQRGHGLEMIANVVKRHIDALYRARATEAKRGRD